MRLGGPPLHECLTGISASFVLTSTTFTRGAATKQVPLPLL